LLLQSLFSTYPSQHTGHVESSTLDRYFLTQWEPPNLHLYKQGPHYGSISPEAVVLYYSFYIRMTLSPEHFVIPGLWKPLFRPEWGQRVGPPQHPCVSSGTIPTGKAPSIPKQM